MENDTLLENYDYDIPSELIAQKPAEKRHESRLFVVNRKTGKFEHKMFFDIADYFNEGDCLVINTTKVVPSRLFGKKESGGKVEFLFLDPAGIGEKLQDNEYKVLIKPSLETGKKVLFGDGFEAEIKEKNSSGETAVKFNKPGVEDLLEKNGIMPLPPYINRKNNLAFELADLDRNRYQTVYADVSGAIAAPTAGLHFTQDIFDKLKKKGVKIAALTLHVGWGTFKPIIKDNVSEHKMLPEKFSIDEQNAEIINSTKAAGKNVFAVGTTSCRALESLAVRQGKILKACSGETDIFIYPGYEFKIIDKLITNLHLPKSTPLMMASAFSSRELMLKAYKEAVKEKYRFFSYGDSMIIL